MLARKAESASAARAVRPNGARLRAVRRLALLLLLVGCSTGDPGSPGGEAADELTPGYLGQRLRRLSSRELTQSITDDVGVLVPDSQVANLYVPRKYDNGDPDSWVTSDAFNTMETLAWSVADQVVAQKIDRVYGGCSDPTACKSRLLGTVVPRIYRRPLRLEEATRYDALWNEDAKAGTDDAVRIVLAAALQSPSFLYRDEIGHHALGDRVAILEAHEIASQISYLIVGSTPDDELLAAARANGLLKKTDRLAQADRLLAMPQAFAQEKHFLGLYLATADTPFLAKSRDRYPGFKPTPISVEFGHMLDDIVLAGASSRSLLSFPHTLAPPMPPQYSDAAAPPVRGVLMHPAFLATHASYDHSGPVARGLFVLTNFLCATPNPPPAGIPRAPSADSKQKTTRGRFAEHSTNPMCQGCHRAIDGIGFGFEEYDGVGRFRTTEDGEPIDASGMLPADSREIGYRGVSELGDLLARSQQVSDCYSMHIVRFALGAGEREIDKALYENLSRAGDPDATYADRIRKIIASPSFVERRLP